MITMQLNRDEESKITKQKVAKPLLWLGIVSMVMLFGGLTSAYVIRQAKGDWLLFELPQTFYFSTAVIIISSVTMNMALQAAKKNELGKITGALAATLILGCVFIYLQVKGWGQLTDQNIFFAGKYANASGSYFYVLSGLHIAHLLGGIIALCMALYKAIKQRYNAQNILGLQLCSIYWHFLDGLWIYLFLFLLFIR